MPESLQAQLRKHMKYWGTSTTIAGDASRVGKRLHNNNLLINRVPAPASYGETGIKSSKLRVQPGCEYRAARGQVLSL